MKLFKWQEEFIKSKKSCLYCDTGMGKSRVGGWILSQASSGLIICPPHLVKEWIEIGKENNIEISELKPTDRKLKIKETGFYAVSVNKVALYGFDIKCFLDILILDEAHRFKNSKSSCWKNTIKIADMFTVGKYAMTATFITKNSCDLIAPALIVADELRWKYKGSYWNFIQTKNNCTFTEQRIKATMIAGIMRKSVKVETGLTEQGRNEILKYFYITDYVSAGLKKPDFSVKKIPFDIEKAHKEILDNEEFPTIDEISELDFRFSDLHQTINCFSYKSKEHYSIEAKTDALKSIIDNENQKGLVFYHFKENRSILLDLKGSMEYTCYDDIKKFEESDCSVLVANYKSIGEGVRLKFCGYIVEFDLIYDYANLLQSRGRLQYAGREDVFKIFRLIPNHPQILKIENNLSEKEKIIQEYKQCAEKTAITEEKTSLSILSELF